MGASTSKPESEPKNPWPVGKRHIVMSASSVCFLHATRLASKTVSIYPRCCNDRPFPQGQVFVITPQSPPAEETWIAQPRLMPADAKKALRHLEIPVRSFPVDFSVRKGVYCIGSFGYVFLSPFALDLPFSIRLEFRRVRMGETRRARGPWSAADRQA